MEKNLSQVVGKVETITPVIAQQYLESSRNKRKLNRRTVTAYATDMAAKKWKLNGEPIVFSMDGQLLAGRHRLSACIEAGVEFTSLVVYNVSADVFDTLDNLRRRTVSDILTIRKLPHGRALASALNIIWNWMYSDIGSTSKTPPIQELLEILETFPQLKESEGKKSNISKAKNCSYALPLGMGIAFHFIFSQADPTKANKLFDQIAEYENTLGNAPGHVLAKAFLNAKHEGGTFPRRSRYAYIIKAWNALYNDENIITLRFGSNEKFPKIEGFSSASTEEIARYPSDVVAKTQQKSELDDIRVEYEMITPKRAREILSKHPKNRRAAEAVIARYARDMKSGNWKLNGQTVKISKSGNLIDGQHRLKACADSGSEFPSLIVYGIEESAFDTFDLGSKRGYYHILSERGEIQATTLAAAVKWLWLYKGDNLRSRQLQPTFAELDATLDKHPSIRDGLVYINRMRHLISPSVAVFCYYACSEKNSENASTFFDQLSDGIGLQREDPAWVLLQRLQRDNRKSRRLRTSDIERMVWLIKAWNAFQSSEVIKTLSWRNLGTGKEQIPAFI